MMSRDIDILSKYHVILVLRYIYGDCAVQFKIYTAIYKIYGLSAIRQGFPYKLSVIIMFPLKPTINSSLFIRFFPVKLFALYGMSRPLNLEAGLVVRMPVIISMQGSCTHHLLKQNLLKMARLPS